MNQMIQQFGRFFAVVGAMAVLWPVAAFECATGMARVEKFDTAELGENRRPPGWSFYQKPDGNGTVSVVCEGEGRAVRIDSSGAAATRSGFHGASERVPDSLTGLRCG